MSFADSLADSLQLNALDSRRDRKNDATKADTAKADTTKAATNNAIKPIAANAAKTGARAIANANAKAAQNDSSNSLSTAASVGIGLGVGAFVLIWLAVAMWLFFRHRERKRLIAIKEKELNNDTYSRPSRTMSFGGSDIASLHYPGSSPSSVGRESLAAPPMPTSSRLNISGPIMPLTQANLSQPSHSRQISRSQLSNLQSPSINESLHNPTATPTVAELPVAFVENERYSQLPPVPRYSQVTRGMVPPTTPGQYPSLEDEQIPAYAPPPRGTSSYRRNTNGFFVRSDEKRPLPEEEEEPDGVNAVP